jgi:hypothetical protein
MDDLPDALNRLSTRLETLERRVYVLEHPSQAPSSLPALEPNPSAIAEAGETPSFALAGGMFPVLGKAMLGIAGAYLLRAVAESGSLPKAAVAAVAIVYAVLWLVGAARVRDGAWFASTTYACTSALILAPMLWELTLRFNVLPASITAGVLIGFAIAASLLARQRAAVLWVAYAGAAGTALALSIASHQLARFLAAILLMAALNEYASLRSRAAGVRTLVAAAADLGILGLIYIYSSPQDTRLDYPVLGTAALLALGFALFAIFAVSVVFKTLPQRRAITVFETIQIMIAFLLAAASLLYFGPLASAMILGVCCVALSAASYAAVFLFFDRMPDRRNYRVFAAWSAALLLAGSWLCLPPLWLAACLGVAAVVATVLGTRLNRQTLEFHGVVYLLAAAAASGLLSFMFRALAGTLAGAPAWSVYLVSACAALCYAAGKRCPRESWKQQLFHFVFASLAFAAAAALLVNGLVVLTALRVIPEAHHLAFIRTLILCAAALALAYGGAHWRRMELTRMGYATLALVATKLLLEDLRQGHLGFIAASIFLFALTLIAVPRIARMEPKI